MAKSTILNSVEEVIEDFRNGRIVIVVDDEDRENEGDFIVAAEKITPEIVNFMLKEGRGVLCAPLSEERCAELGLNMMEENNTSLLGTPFTVTVDLLGNGCTTGVSIHDRAATIRALADPATRATDLGRPGHINPLRARQKGVLRRPGHTEAAIDLARLAGLQPAGALIEIMNEDGTMARLPQLTEIARKFGLKIISIPAARRIHRREGRDRRPADRMGRLPHHAVPAEEQRAGARGAHQRRVDGRRTGADTRAFVVRHGRHLRLVPLRLRRSAARSDAHDRKGG